MISRAQSAGFLLAIALVVALAVSMQQNTARPQPVVVECTDSDGGNQEHVAGIVHYQGKLFADYCRGRENAVGHDHLIEYACENGAVTETLFDCDYSCAGNACLPKPARQCTDYDADNNPFFPGSVCMTFADNSAVCTQDVCDGNILVETACENNTATTLRVACEFGCSHGSCTRAPA